MLDRSLRKNVRFMGHTGAGVFFFLALNVISAEQKYIRAEFKK
jgi:hypothetical protein